MPVGTREDSERVVTVALQEADLAWALADAVKSNLSSIERNHVFMAIGAGETFAAIRGLVKSVAVKRIELRPDLVQQCITWSHAYAGHKDEQYLRRLIADFVLPNSIHAPAMLPGNRIRPRQRAVTLVALAAQRHHIGSATDAPLGSRAGIG